MRIVFLDIDGVLVHHRCKADEGERFITNGDPRCAERLKRILDTTGAKLVIHSTWAYVDSRDYLINFLRQFGITEAYLHPDFICTSTDHGERDKVEAIDTWLANHRGKVSRFIILEDEQLYGLQDIRRGNLIHISGGWTAGGIQDKHADIAIKCLTYRF